MIQSAAAGASAGAALWCSLGVLDRVVTSQGAFRVAMLPPWWALAVLIVAGAAVSIAYARLSADPARTLPLFGLLVLVLPYLPVVAERLPAVNVLAGPARWLVWIIVLSPPLLRIGYSTLATRVRAHVQANRGKASSRGSLASFAAGVLLLGVIATRVTGTALAPGGDEPHYLIMMQSLIRDGDLKIENNHRRGDYEEYFASELKPHYLTRGVDREIYSVHPVGLPILAAPAFAVAGYPGVVAALVIAGAAAGALLWRWAYVLTASAGAAWFGWAATALSVPFAFQSVAVYPEILAALAVIVALSWSHAPRRGPTEPLEGATAPGSPGRDLVPAIAAAALPWLSTKYAPMSGAIMAVLLWRIWRADGTRHARLIRSGMTLVPYVVSLAAWFTFFYVFWGSALPSAPYGTYHQTRAAHLRVGLPGLFFDQEYGVVPYAPVLMVGLTGLVVMLLSRKGTRRNLALELGLVLGALLAAVGAFRIWWGGSATPGRALVSGLLLLGVPIALQYAQAAGNRAARAAYHILLVLGLSLTALMVGFRQGALSANGRDGSSTLLEWLSPSWPAWHVVPTIIASDIWRAALLATIWVAVAVTAAALVYRAARATAQPFAELMSFLTITAATLAATALAPLVFAGETATDRMLEARVRVPLLDGFDARRLPVAVIYDPFRFVPATSLPPLVSLVASPDIDRPMPPEPVLFNGRFVLPAGEYEVQITTNPEAASSELMALALRLGPGGRPLEPWTVSLPTRGVWWRRFSMPIDVSFVGFIASDALAPAISALRVSPVRVTDASRRPRTPPVVATSRFGAATLYFHTDPAWPEPAGFWTAGQSTTQFTIAAPTATRLRLRAGAGGNTVTVTTPAGRNDVTLAAGQSSDVPLAEGSRAQAAGEPMLISVTTASGFRPADVEPTSRDRRFLGCWVEVVTGDAVK